MRQVEGVKIYGVCLERLQYQIKLARERMSKSPDIADDERGIVLESYNTGDMDEIIDLLEIYDVPDEKRETVIDKLSQVAYSASLLVGETVEFGFCDEGFLCLYLKPGGEKDSK